MSDESGAAPREKTTRLNGFMALLADCAEQQSITHCAALSDRQALPTQTKWITPIHPVTRTPSIMTGVVFFVLEPLDIATTRSHQILKAFSQDWGTGVEMFVMIAFVIFLKGCGVDT